MPERKPKPARQPRKRRPQREYVIVDTSEGPEDPEAAAALIAAWLDSLGGQRKK